MADDPLAPRRDPVPVRRDAEARRRDHAEIDRLADELLPDLLGRLTASGLGEIEVREDDWRIRLRRPANVSVPAAKGAQRGSAAGRADGSAGAEGSPRAGMGGGAGAPAGAASVPSMPASVRRDGRVPATSPAVGVFQARPEATLGVRVRAGDRLAVVDLLGVPQDVVAPDDGVVVDVLVDSGEGVEYGQELILIEPAVRGRPMTGDDDAGGAGATDGTGPAGDGARAGDLDGVRAEPSAVLVDAAIES
jgi:acetyl-CoA carboxylase biotin carboxyl carrier protein